MNTAIGIRYKGMAKTITKVGLLRQRTAKIITDIYKTKNFNISFPKPKPWKAPKLTKKRTRKRNRGMSSHKELLKAQTMASERIALIYKLQSALGTEERGEALVEVARNAHKAEQELAAWKAVIYDSDLSIDEIAHWVYKKLNEGNKK